jgi:hypothetical protein
VLDINATDEIELNATLVDINANVEISGTATTTGVHTFTAVPVFPNNTIETADIQADAITAAKIADNAVVTAGINADAVTGAKIADDAINSEHYTDGSIDTAHIADAQITTAKLATAVLTGATDIGAAIADADLFLVDDGAGGTLRKTAASRLKTYIGDNTPSFLAYLGEDAAQAQNADTKIAFNVEMYDNSGVYDNSSNYRFTPGVAGKYFIFSRVGAYGGSRGYKQITSIKKNGTIIAQHSDEIDLTTVWTANFTRTQFVSVVDIADADDYYEVFVLARLASSGNVAIDYNANYPYTHFGAYRIIGA